MRSSGRKLKGTARDSAPTVLVTVGVASRRTNSTDGSTSHPYTLVDACVSVSRRTKAGWGAAVETRCATAADAWRVIDAVGKKGRRVYVVAARASDTLTLLGWWQRVGRREVTIWEKTADRKPGEPKKRRHPLVMQGRPDIIGYSVRGCPFRWVSVTNWCDISIRDAAEQIGYDTAIGIDPGDKWESLAVDPIHQCRIICGYMRRLIDWWLENGCGGWQDTPGAAAWSSYLRRQGDYPIVQHSDIDAMKLESAACFGGRASTFFFGPIGDPDRWGELASAPDPGPHGFGLPGPVIRYDVRSMYPSLLRDERYPVRLLRHDTRPTLATLRSGLRYMLCIARVTIRTGRAIYPRRHGQDVSYPVGEFVTHLSTPEVAQALAAGEIVGVHSVAWYTPGSPFRRWADWAIGLRVGMRESADRCGEAMVKLLANSLGGRLARRRMGWDDRPRAIPRVLWGDWWHTDRESGETSQWRSLCGHVQQMTREDHRPATLAACYAHLTAYGRCMMNRVREVAGRREAIWQDTDGIVVTALGGKRIEASAYYHPTAIGSLRKERVISHGRYLTAKHYWIDGGWVLSGIHDGFTVDDSMRATDVVTSNPARSAIDPRETAVYRSTRCIDLRRIEPGVEIDSDGWAIPPTVQIDPTPGRARGQLLFPEVG